MESVLQTTDVLNIIKKHIVAIQSNAKEYSPANNQAESYNQIAAKLTSYTNRAEQIIAKYTTCQSGSSASPAGMFEAEAVTADADGGISKGFGDKMNPYGRT